MWEHSFSRVLTLGSLLGLSVLAGCASPHPIYLRKNWTSIPARVAILPMNNFTTDFDGPKVVRDLTHKYFEMSGFQVPSDQEVDNQLREKLGITDGGQLPSVTPQKLGEVLGVDGLLYGELEEFNYINLGFFQNRIVAGHYWLVDSTTGEKLWEDAQKVNNPWIETDSKKAKKAFAVGLAVKLAERALHAPLAPESALMVNRVFVTCPKRVQVLLPVALPTRERMEFQYHN